MASAIDRNFLVSGSNSNTKTHNSTQTASRAFTTPTTVSKASSMTSTEAARHQNSSMLQDTYNQLKNTVNSYTPSSNSGGDSSYYDGDAMNQIRSYYQSLSDDALENLISSIQSRLGSAKSAYNNQIDDVNSQLDNLINQSEVERHKNRKAMRTALANKGQLDSGLGRFETLFNDINSGNRVTNLNSQRAQAINEIKNLITQAEAQANSDIASAKNNSANQMLQWALYNS